MYKETSEIKFCLFYNSFLGKKFFYENFRANETTIWEM